MRNVYYQAAEKMMIKVFMKRKGEEKPETIDYAIALG
jgi:hypothetical protein